MQSIRQRDEETSEILLKMTTVTQGTVLSFFLDEKLKQNLSQEVFTFWKNVAMFLGQPTLILTLRQARHCRIITV